MPLNPFRSKPVKGYTSARERYIENNPNARIAKAANDPKAVAKAEAKEKVDNAKRTANSCKKCVKDGASYVFCGKHKGLSKIIAKGYK